MTDWILEVSDLNEYVRKTLAADPMLRSVRLRGEISNFKRHTSGHWYFTLKDDRCRINCVMFRQNTVRMSIRPQDGMSVVLSGSVSLYAEGGAYQFYADNMRPDGVGALYQQFEQLKAKLMAEGLFDAGRKKPLPLRPRKIAVVTSATGAVLQDIRRVAGRRDHGVPLVLLPVLVQGDDAPLQVAEAIMKAGTLPGVDVIITGRGGGSMEDLWAFNEEIVARAIASSPVPVISAVGHETDFTIADFVADVRASTPSNAAELAVPDRTELLEALRQMASRLRHGAVSQVDGCRMRLMAATRRLAALQPEQKLSVLAGRVSLNRERLDRIMQARLAVEAPRVASLQGRLDHAADTLLTASENRLARLGVRLTAIGPLRVLDRGYALVMAAGRVVSTAETATRTDRMTLTFRDGRVAVRRDETEK